MNSDLIPVSQKHSAKTTDRFDLTRIDPPAAGQYWRLLKDLEETRNKVEDHDALKAGLVLLIKEIETQVDGTPHAVHLAPHPLWYAVDRYTPDSPTFMYETFLDLWELAVDGLQVREKELAKLQSDMQSVQRKMLEPPPQDKIDGILNRDPSPNAGGVGQELATVAGLKDMKAHAEMAKEKAEKQIGWITRHTTALGRLTNQLAHFHQEQAEAMLAKANAQIKSLGKIFETVKNLKLYTGEGTDVFQVCDGDPAEPEARLVFYQDVLNLDEELLIHVDAGGMSHHNVDDLPVVLKDPAIASRLIPSPRGFCLMRFRATDKEFFTVRDGADASEILSAAYGNARENEVAKLKRLLYRDGERFYIISNSDVFHGIDQLLPSTGEQNDYFNREGKFRRTRTEANDPDAHKILPDDLDYARAQHEQLGKLNNYARVLIICWGLHDRTELFETTVIPKFCNWLDSGIQLSFMELVSHDNLIGETREDYSAYRKRANELLGPGATVIVSLDRLVSDTTTPGLFGPPQTNGDRNLIYRPVDNYLIGRVRIQSGRYFIEFEAEYNGWSGRARRRHITTKCFLDSTDSDDFIVLDRLHEPDLTYYLTSRRQRKAYSRYVSLFQKARDHVQNRDRQELPIRSFLRKAVENGCIAYNPDDLEAALTAAIAVWRTARSYRGLVLPSEAGWSAASKLLLSATHSALVSHNERIQAAAALAKSQGRLPLRLAHKGNDSWHLYATAIRSEQDARVGAWPWVADLDLSWGRDGEPNVNSVSPHLLRKQAGELIIHEWAEAATHEGASSPDDLSLGSILGALDAAARLAVLPSPFANLSQDDLVNLAVRGTRWCRTQPGNYVIRPALIIPVGTAVNGTIILTERRVNDDALPNMHDAKYTRTYSATNGPPFILVATVDLWSYCYANTEGDYKEAVLSEAVSCYSNKAKARKHLDEANFSLKGIKLRGFNTNTDDAYWIGNPNTSFFIGGNFDNGSYFWGDPTGQEEHAWRQTFPDGKNYHGRKAPYTRITTMGSFGASLFQVAAAVCEQPLGRKTC